MASAPFTSSGFVDHSTLSSLEGPYPSGQITRKVSPAIEQTCHKDLETLFQSPTYTSSLPENVFHASASVRMSASAWHGCSESLRPLMTGTDANSARFSRSSCLKTRATMASTQQERFR